MQVLKFFIRLILFWMLYFTLGRIITIIYQIHQVSTTGLMEIPLIFIYALRLDVATIGIFLIIPFIAWLIFEFSGWKKIFVLVNILNYGLIVIISLLICSELELAREWGSKVNFRAISYLAYPVEAYASVAALPLWLLFTILILFLSVSLVIYRKMFSEIELQRLKKWRVRISAVICIPPLLFLAIRGGWQEISINSSNAYYSSNHMNNLIAVNSGWSFMEAMNAARSTSNPYHFFPMDQARIESRKLFSTGKHLSFLNKAKPNIVLLILESWTADAVPSLGGEVGIAPNFEKLIPEGMLFTNFYSSGVRSHQGLISVLSSFPAMSNTIHNPHQMQVLPCLAKDLKKAGYSSTFLHGGDLNFSNFRSYLRFCGFDRLISIEDFPSEFTAGKWGAHDEYVLDRQIEILREAKEPFFSALFTLSSHEPFKVPGETPYKGKSLADKFRGALHYSDESLGIYFKKVRHEPWFKNTIFILVADHGHRLPLLRTDYLPERYHIPLLILGEPLKMNFRGKKMSNIGSQIDITTTLLSELGLPSQQYRWSKDLMSEPAVSFAYYSFDDGFGLIETGRTTVYDKRTGRWAITKNDKRPKVSVSNDQNESLKLGQAMMQSIYQDHLEMH